MESISHISPIITGTTGMVGKGVLMECLEDERIDKILIINRVPSGIAHPKLKELIVKNFMELEEHKTDLVGYNACFFCAGVSSVGLSEENYKKLTYDLTLYVAKLLVSINRDITFCYVSGTGTDHTEKSSRMWARIKGATENKLLSLSFKAAYMFRPGYIQPLKGIKSKTGWYNLVYTIFKPLYPLLKYLFPNQITSTVKVGQAMINVVLYGYHLNHLENRDINLMANKTNQLKVA